MSEKARFEVTLEGNFERQAKRNAAAAGLFRRNAAGMGRSAVGMSGGARKAAMALGAIGTAATAVGTAAVAAGAAATAAFLAIGVPAARRIEETEALVFALDRLTHHGRKTFDDMRQMSQDLGLDIDQTAHSMANFLKLQFPESEAKKYIKLGADMQALGNSAEDVQGIFRALGQIRSKGRIQAEEMLQLAERGVSQDLIYSSLARNRGLTGPDARTQILALQQQGEISATEFFVAFEEAINTKLGQSQAGQSAANFVQNTFRGSKNRLKAQATNFWIDLADFAKPGLQAGFTALSDGMERLMSDEANMRTLERIMSGVGEGFRILGQVLPVVADGAIKLTGSFSDSFLRAYSGLGGDGFNAADGMSAVERAMASLKPIAETLGALFGGIARSLELIQDLGGWFFEQTTAPESIMSAERKSRSRGYGMVQSDPSDEPERTFSGRRSRSRGRGTAVGGDYGAGVVQGLTEKQQAVMEASAALGRSMEQGTRDATQTHSPSRVAMEVGQDWNEGLQMGIDSSPVMAVPGGKMPTGGGNGMAGGLSIGKIDIMVQGSADPMQTAQATLRVFERDLGAVFARWAGEAGAA